MKKRASANELARLDVLHRRQFSAKKERGDLRNEHQFETAIENVKGQIRLLMSGILETLAE